MQTPPQNSKKKRKNQKMVSALLPIRERHHWDTPSSATTLDAPLRRSSHQSTRSQRKRSLVP